MKMKKLPLLLLTGIFSILLSLNSCKKESESIEQIPEIDHLESMPISFTKKVLIEEFTAEWCIGCTDVYDDLKIVLDENPSTVFLTTIHFNDPFSTDQTDQLKADFEVPGFPSTMVDRFTFNNENSPRTYYYTSIMKYRSDIRLVGKIPTGVKIETEIIENGKANITVYVGSNEFFSGTPRLTTYLQEEKLLHINQTGTSDPNYSHHHVLREVLTNVQGATLNSTENKRDINIFKYENVDISDYEEGNLEVVAFVHYYDNSDITNHEIINVQKVKLGGNQDWD